MYKTGSYVQICNNLEWKRIWKKECVHICICIYIHTYTYTHWISQVRLVAKNLPANAWDIRDAGLIPGLGRSFGERHGNPLLYSCLENLIDRGAWRAPVHRVANSWTRLKWLSTQQIHIHTQICKMLQKNPNEPFWLTYLLCMLSCVQLSATPWTVALQASLSMGFPRQEYWSGFAVSSPRGFSWPRDQIYISYISCTAGVIHTCVCVCVCVYLNHFAVYLKRCRYTSIKKKKLILQWLNKIKIISYSFLYSHLVVVVVQSLNCVWFLRPHGLLCQAPLSTGFPRQESWSELPFPSPGDLHDPGIKPSSPTCRFFTTEPPGKPRIPS